MKKINKNKMMCYIYFLRLLPADLLYHFSGNRGLIDSDFQRMMGEIPYDKVCVGALNYCLIYIKPYRSVFYFRTQKSKILRHLSRWFIRPLDTIEIHGKIGEGFAIYHTYSVIHPYSAGKNLTVGHGVTIGKGRPMPGHPDIVDPVIGDNVHIYTGAIVFGGIHIGNNVEIGAGALVNKDVPDNCTVIGNPMRIIPNY